MTKDYRRELQGLLRKLFQFDSADLDFGIYRIMNYKRDEIEKFIEEDLIKAVDVEFEKYSAKSKEEIESELEEIKKRISSTLGEDALLPSGDIKEMYRGSPIAKEFYRKKENLKNNEMVDQHKAEIFSHIYQFFSRYYDEGDFISRRRYSRQNKYAIPYNGEEVLLHWANKDQYYIKTGEYFKNYSFKIGDYKINFTLLDAETDQNNNRSGNRFFLLSDSSESTVYNENAKELTIFFEYRALTSDETAKYGTRDIQKKILDEAQVIIVVRLNNDALRIALQKKENDRTLLEKHLLRYTKRNTTDYFIHKDLRGFLSGELDFYIKNEILNLDDLGSEREIDVEKYIGRINVVKSICLKIIDFLTQIENFQRMLFEKKKFVIRTEYCITLDRVPEELYEYVAQNQYQIDEWNRLFKLNKTIKGALAQYSPKSIDVEYLKTHSYLVLDTKFYNKEFKDKLIASFSDLDSDIGGYMIKSENFQALNLLKERFNGKIKCIYIDPPYNTGNDEFIYKDNYQHSSWLSMLFDRVSLTHQMLRDDGIFFSSIDDTEAFRYQLILQEIFGLENFLVGLVWEKRYAPPPDTGGIGYIHELIHTCRKSREFERNLLQLTEEQMARYKNRDNDPRGPWKAENYTCRYTSDERPNLYYPIIHPLTGEKIWPKKSRVWAFSQEKHLQNVSENRIWWGEDGTNKVPSLKNFAIKIQQGMIPTSLLFHKIAGHTDEAAKELRKMFPDIKMTPKPVRLIKHLLAIGSDSSSIVLDFFSGSGTTAQGVIRSNQDDGGKRKYILIEMADYFETVMKPRIQKVMYSNDWEEGTPNSDEGISHIFKYIYLEQYEDTLNNINFSNNDLSIQKTLQDLEGYSLRYMLDFETQDSPCRLNVDKLIHPFDYELKIAANNEISNQKVDLVETFNLLLGIHVKKIKAFINNGSHYKAVLGNKNEETITVIWRTTDGLDLEADKKFIEDHILNEFKANKVYVNSDCFVEGVIPIEPEFKCLMEA